MARGGVVVLERVLDSPGVVEAVILALRAMPSVSVDAAPRHPNSSSTPVRISPDCYARRPRPKRETGLYGKKHARELQRLRERRSPLAEQPHPTTLGTPTPCRRPPLPPRPAGTATHVA